MIFFICYANVPVLSNIILFILDTFSKTQFFLIKMPFFTAIFKVFTITVGIANPIAQGQLATKTDIALSNGKHQLQKLFI